MYKNSSEKTHKTVAAIKFDATQNILILTGEWSWVMLDEKILTRIPEISGTNYSIDGSQITYMDTTGVFFLGKIKDILAKQGKSCLAVKLISADQALLDLATNITPQTMDLNAHAEKSNSVEQIGKRTLHVWYVGLELLTFFGYICYSIATIFKKTHSHSLYVRGVVETVSSAGIKGIAISSLLCFLIGVNLTYQMSPQFVTYGANVYVVNFLGIALLREVTPLLTAVIVAGRTGSAITASIGTMKVQEEIDALRTMGISPMRRLVIPRVIGLLISLPILTMIADVASMFGGMLVSATSLDVSYSLFLHRMQTYVSINNYAIGIVKTFAFAWIIAMVGCFCGFRVKSNSESIGVQTTRSVVMSICLIIVVDAIFAIMFKALKM